MNERRLEVKADFLTRVFSILYHTYMVMEPPPFPVKHPRIGVGCIVQHEGKVLLGKRKGSHGVGFWGFPGVHLEFGESVESCAKRELLEETGLTPLSLRLGSWVENIME